MSLVALAFDGMVKMLGRMEGKMVGAPQSVTQPSGLVPPNIKLEVRTRVLRLLPLKFTNNLALIVS